MKHTSQPRNVGLLKASKAVLFAAVVAAILSAANMGSSAAVSAGAIVGVVSLLSGELATMLAVIFISVPVAISAPVLGLATLIVGIASVRYLGADDGRPFLIVSTAAICAFIPAWGPLWAPVVLAGYLFGATEGAMAAAVAALLIGVAGLATGQASVGVTITGGAPPAVVSLRPPEGGLFSTAWFAPMLAGLSADGVREVAGLFSNAARPVAFVLQPAAWALGAASTGLIAASAREKKRPVLGYAGVLVGTAIIMLSQALIASFTRTPIAVGSIGTAGALSAIVALALAVVWDRVFAPIPVAAAPGKPRPSSVAAEDADVDELLRLISTAEEKLDQHTTQRVVMITDMKSFSRMAEEEGSVLTAKAVQRHRDLLLPVIQRFGGNGKSTGEDGLVAAFTDPAEAVSAAVEMQRVLSEYNAAHAGERDISVRIGIASGEVVLDRSGRPFIGTALNVAARVMNLADGGQVFMTADVARAAKPTVPMHSHGEFQLKNIAEPVEIVEALWHDGQAPASPITHSGGA